MWTCKICGEVVDDDSWQTCWKCSSNRDGSPEELTELAEKHQKRIQRFQQCLRCESKLEYAGTKRFHEGAKMGFWLGDLGELFVGREYYDVYFCPHCGKVELYVDGIGDDLRGETDV